MGVSGGKAKKAAAKPVLSERQQKWFASVEASLERDTGKTLAEWVKLAKKCPEATPGKRTLWLREKYGLGVNRIAHILSAAFPEGPSWDDPDALLQQLWKEPAGRAIYETVAKLCIAGSGHRPTQNFCLLLGKDPVRSDYSGEGWQGRDGVSVAPQRKQTSRADEAAAMGREAHGIAAVIAERSRR